MSVAIKFQILCNNLTVDTETRRKISERYQMITARLNYDFWATNSSALHSLYVGSYGRRTAVRGFSDLDILFILPSDLCARYNQYSYNGQSALLQAVKQSVTKSYPNTHIGGDGQVVSVSFSDRITFEIVPAFIKNDYSFIYPDSNNGGSWKTTNPIPEIDCIKLNNELTNGNLKNLCRMARAWRNKWDVPMGGLLIDTLANNFLIDWKYKNETYLYYDWMTRDFLKYLSNQEENKKYWFAVGSNQYVYRKGNFEYKAKKCYNLALEAIEYESNKMTFSATQKWKEIYGTAYPNV